MGYLLCQVILLYSTDSNEVNGISGRKETINAEAQSTLRNNWKEKKTDPTREHSSPARP
jgi:hypothetical protein